MGFIRYDEDGNPKGLRVSVDCSEDEIIVEQSHKEEVNINSIIKRHGIDLVTKVANLRSSEYQFDDVTGNDFQEAMNIVIKAQDTFQNLPHQVRDKFDNSPAKFLDFVQNPDNNDKMVEMGLAHPPPPPPPVVAENVTPEATAPDTVA